MSLEGRHDHHRQVWGCEDTRDSSLSAAAGRETSSRAPRRSPVLRLMRRCLESTVAWEGKRSEGKVPRFCLVLSYLHPQWGRRVQKWHLPEQGTRRKKTEKEKWVLQGTLPPENSQEQSAMFFSFIIIPFYTVVSWKRNQIIQLTQNRTTDCLEKTNSANGLQ